MEAHLTECVQEALAAFQYRNATFLAERLHTSLPTEARVPGAARALRRLTRSLQGNAVLLGTCHLRSRQTLRAYAVLKGAETPEGRYLLAVACAELLKLAEAEQALTGGSESGEVPGGAAGHYLLATVLLKSSQEPQAVRHLCAALEADPFCWSAYEQLCALGHAEEAARLLDGASPAALYPSVEAEGGGGAGACFSTPQGGEVQEDASMLSTPVAPPGAASASPGSGRGAATHGLRSGDADAEMGMSGSEMSTPMPRHSFVTPSPAVAPLASHAPHAAKALQGAHGRAATPSVASGFTTAPKADSLLSLLSPNAGHRRKFVDEGKLRKVSGRLFSDAVPAQSLRRSSRLSGMPPSAAPLQMTPASAMPVTAEARRRPVAAADEDVPQLRWDVPGGGKSAEGAEEALRLLRLLGLGYRLRSQHRCKEAVGAFSRLPPLHYRSAWVLVQLGRAHADAADYAQAERTFGALRSLCPFQLEGLEHYSTVLWHLKRDTQLAQLAHEALALDRLSPVAWCVVGNCLSLQREHEAALKAFGRAASLDVECTYAYTLAGHEHLAAEDWEQAKRSYRIATALDGRHYNAWYGLGAVFMRQEKYDLAEYHFRRALDCHPSSSVLRCCLGQALHAVGRHEEALQELNAAVAADARNPLARFERASLLVSKGALQEALKELSALKDVAPREASVYVLLSKVYKRLNQPGLAALCAGTGADLGGAKEAGREEEEETVRGGDVVPV